MDAFAQHPDLAQLPPSHARRLLRKLRDLDLHSGPIAVADDRHATLSGCVSLDHPAEYDLRYRIGLDGAEHVLAIGIRSAWLELELTLHGATTRRIAFPLGLDAHERITAPDLGARVDPDTRDARELEHFLRRVVRGLLGAA